MQCTPQQIEEKKRQAQLKLAAKLNQNKNNVLSPVKNVNINTGSSASVVTPPQGNPFKAFSNSSGSAYSPIRNTYSISVANSGHKPQDSVFKRYCGSPGDNFRNHGTKPYDKTKQQTDKPKPTVPFYGKSNVITGTCYLISEERFAAELSSYSAQAVDIFKTLPSRSYDTKTRIWSFHIKDYEPFQHKISVLQPDIVVGKIPPYALNCCRMPKSDYATIDLSKLDPELSSALMPFQQEGVCFGIDKNGRCLIADDMGLGKTFQALAIANYYKGDWPLLIATTASMKNTWEETIHRYLPSVSVMYTQYMVSAKDYIGDAKILIVSHDLMSRCSEKLLERNFGVMIIDESHTLKNFKAKCTKVATDLSKKAKRVILLSGTPALSRPSELYTQLAIIDEKFFGNFINYSKRYCDGKTTNFGWDASGKSNLQELEVILGKKFMIRRTKEDVLKSLPNKTQEVVCLDVNLDGLSESDRRALNALAARFNGEKKGNEKHSILLTFFCETAKIKIPSVCSYVLNVLEETNKFLVFAHHQIMLNAIEQVMVKKDKKFIRIDGNTSSSQRKFLVDKFQYDDSYTCAILSITAANAGITLTAAQLVIFAELHWNPSILSQAEARAHRIGQEGHVVVRYLLAKGTADDSIWPMLQNKQKILQEAGLSKDSFNDVTVSEQKNISLKGEHIAECLNTSITSSNTLDITTYFKSPVKSEAPKSNSDSNGNLSKEEEDFFNDNLDDILGSVDISF